VAAILGFVWKRPWVIALGALLLLSGGLYLRLKAVSSKLDQVNRELAVVSAEIEVQNAAIEAWKAATADQTDRVSVARRAAVRQRTASDARVRELLAAQVPAACSDAIRWAATTGRAIAAEWEEAP
jgi:hypothetical protein